MEHRLCIVGGGPRATYVLQHMLAAWQARPLQGQLRVCLVEPAEFGAGATYRTSQPDFLRLNTIAAQVTAYPDDTVVTPLVGPRGPTLHQYYRTPCNGMAADAYPSREQTGRYLAEVFKKMVTEVPSSVTVECRRTSAVDMRRTHDGQWNIQLGDGQEVRCDAAVLAVGGTASAQMDAAILANELGIPQTAADQHLLPHPYPIEQILPRLRPGETVGILGLGLTALDIIRACTVGRGGTFQRYRGELRYLPCGDEPRLVAWSRTGLPLLARAVNQKSIDQKVEAQFLTEETIDKLRRERQRRFGSPKLDFVLDLLPLLVCEMAEAFERAKARRRRNVAGLGRKPSRFHWQRLVWPISSKALRSADSFESFFLKYLRSDIAEALQGNLSSPVKSACDVIRDLRDKLRYAVEFGSLTPDSQRWFDTEFTPIHNRLAVGPPVEATEEFLALVQAGIVDPFCGPNPRLQWDARSGSLSLCPTGFEGPARELSVVVNARIGATDVARTASPLVRSLIAEGHMVPYVNTLNGTAYRPGGIAVTDIYRVINRHDRAHASLFATGAITDGCTWYSQVLARPFVNSRSMRDAATVAQALWEYFAGRSSVRTNGAAVNGHPSADKNLNQQVELPKAEPIPALT
jgi:uncharacterized NAD(P)/FAD-binding protein YdhS